MMHDPPLSRNGCPVVRHFKYLDIWMGSKGYSELHIDKVRAKSRMEFLYCNESC